jgi:hypothetical protein
MILFTKPNCKKCDYIKETFSPDKLKELGVTVYELKPSGDALNEQIKSAVALGLLAYWEGVKISEKQLPILIIETGDKLVTAIDIKNHLLKKLKERGKYEKNTLQGLSGI